MTDGEPQPLRDDVFWTAVLATYAAGVSVKRTCALFGLSRDALYARARDGGWLRRDRRRRAEKAVAASIAADAPGVEDARHGATAPSASGAAGTLDAAVIVPKALAAADAAITRAAEAAARADAVEAEIAIKLGERMARTANVLGRTKTPKPSQKADVPGEKRNELLRKIHHTLEGARQARQIEVEALRERGIDPREAWVWDAEDGDWVWDPGGAMARASQQSRPSIEDQQTCQ